MVRLLLALLLFAAPPRFRAAPLLVRPQRSASHVRNNVL